MTRFSLFRAATLAAPVGLIAAPAIAGESDARLLDEAKALFRTELRNALPPQRCEYGLAWDPDTQGVALKALGEAPYPAPATLPAPADVIDLQGDKASAFCSEEEQRRDQVARATDLDAKNPGFILVGKRYSFPVFNRSFTFAAFLVTTERNEWHWMKGVRNLDIQSFSTASELFVKKDGAWRMFLVTRISDFEVFSGPRR